MKDQIVLHKDCKYFIIALDHSYDIIYITEVKRNTLIFESLRAGKTVEYHLGDFFRMLETGQLRILKIDER